MLNRVYKIILHQILEWSTLAEFATKAFRLQHKSIWEENAEFVCSLWKSRHTWPIKLPTKFLLSMKLTAYNCHFRFCQKNWLWDLNFSWHLLKFLEMIKLISGIYGITISNGYYFIQFCNIGENGYI